ncbi:hypothetical protein D3C79_595440 [compost metagenome]
MPVQVRFQCRDLHRQRLITQLMATGEALGNRHRHVGLLQHLRRHQVVLRTQGDFALNTHLAQRQVDVTQAVAAAGDMDMGHAQVAVEGQLAVSQRVALAQGADIAVLHQFDVAHLRVGVQWRVDGKVQAAGREFLGGLAALAQEAFDHDCRRQAAQALEQRRQDDRLGQVGHADAEGLVGLLRVERAAFLHRSPQQRQRVAHRADDVLRHGCGHHALRGTHEQRVIEGFAQARQGIGHCRLGNADDLPGAGQVGFGVDRIEHDEQVEVDLAEVHGRRSLLELSADHISVMNVYTRGK